MNLLNSFFMINAAVPTIFFENSESGTYSISFEKGLYRAVFISGGGGGIDFLNVRTGIHKAALGGVGGTVQIIFNIPAPCVANLTIGEGGASKVLTSGELHPTDYASAGGNTILTGLPNLTINVSGGAGGYINSGTAVGGNIGSVSVSGSAIEYTLINSNNTPIAPYASQKGVINHYHFNDNWTPNTQEGAGGYAVRGLVEASGISGYCKIERLHN